MRSCAYHVGSIELTGQSNRLSLDAEVAELEGTTFGDSGNKTVFGGIESASITGGGFVDLGSVYDAEQFRRTRTRELLPHTIGPSNSGSAVGATAYVVKALATSLRATNQVGELVQWELNASGSSRTGYGAYLWSPATSVTTTADGTAVLVGAVASGKAGLATLHVLERTGTATLDVVIESDATDAFSGSETSRITFAQASAVGSQFKSVDGPITDTYWRAALTVGGSGSLTIVVGFGISLFAV